MDSSDYSISDASDDYIAYRARENWRCTEPLCRRPVTHILRRPDAHPQRTGICARYADRYADKYKLTIEPAGIHDALPSTKGI